MTAAQELDQLVERRNGLSAQIGPKKQAGHDVTTLIREHAKITERIKQVEEALSATAETGEYSDTRELRVEVVTQADEFEAMRDDWHQLEEDSDNFSVFMSWEWMYTWWEVFGGGKQLHIITVRDHNDRLVGLFPLMRVRKFAGLRRSEELAFIGTGARAKSDYLGFMAAQGDQSDVDKTLVARLLADVRDAGSAVLCGMPSDGMCTDVILRSALADGLAIGVTTDQTTVHGELPDTFEAFLASVPCKTRRKRLRNRPGKLRDEFATVEYTEANDQAEIERMLADLGDLSVKHFGRGLLGSAWSHDAFRRFLVKAAVDLARRGNLRLEQLTLDEGTAATSLGLVYRGTYFCYQASFERTLDRWEPAHCLFAHIIRALIGARVKRFEFGRGVHEYKASYFGNRARLLSIRLMSEEPESIRKAGYSLVADGLLQSAKRLISRG